MPFKQNELLLIACFANVLEAMLRFAMLFMMCPHFG